MPDMIRSLLVEQKMIFEERIANLTKERDEARKMYCREMSDSVNPYRSPEEIADGRGWDCFKENTND
jgi:hypothetical protein